MEGFDYGDLSDNYVNFVAGAKYVNPKIKTSISYVGSWTDTEKSKQTALAQIESGVDSIYSSGDLIGAGVISACQEKNCREKTVSRLHKEKGFTEIQTVSDCRRGC